MSENWIVLLVLGGLVAAAVWYARPAALFVVRIRAGRPEATHGTVTTAFLSRVTELCDEFGVASGEVHGLPRGRRIALWFSSDLPAGFRQRLRNWWALSGWRAPPGRR